MNDVLLQELVDQELRRAGDGDPVTATVKDGVVTLTGAVRHDMRRILIEQVLLAIPEVSDVHNQLRVLESAGDLRTRLRSLLDSEDVKADAIEVVVHGGDVTLSGMAPSWFDRDSAERLAWTVPGVRSVLNRIGLPPDAVVPDDEGSGMPLG
jgi:osmotically-inducible protein OsmY